MIFCLQFIMLITLLPLIDSLPDQLKCYTAKFEPSKKTSLSVLKTDIEGWKSVTRMSKHVQYRVRLHWRLCNPVGSKSYCEATQLKRMDLLDNELREAIATGKCLADRDCLEDHCYDTREERCTKADRPSWINPKPAAVLDIYRIALRWACQTSWECINRTFKTNIQLLSTNPLSYRFETPEGAFLKCSDELPYVEDPTGHFVSCPKPNIEKVKEKFHCIKHPDRILCRAQSDHALVDFTNKFDQPIDGTLYSISNETHWELKAEQNELASGTISDSKKLMREMEMDNLQLILDATVLRNRMVAIENLLVRTIQKLSKGDATIIGDIIGDGSLTERLIDGVEYYQCVNQTSTSCGCMKRKEKGLECRKAAGCEGNKSNGYFSILPEFSNTSLAIDLSQTVLFRERIKDLWINDILVESSRKVETGGGASSWATGGWFSPVERFLKDVWGQIVNSFFTILSLCLSLYSIKLHLRNKK